MKKLFFVLKFALPLLLIFVVLIVPPRIIKIHSVSCKSQFGSCDETISESLSQARGKSYKEAKRLVEEILGKDVSIEKYSIRYQLPQGLSIDILERKAVHAIQMTSGEIYIVDSRGVILSKTDSTSLPKLFIDKNEFKVGDKISTELTNALKIVYDLNYLYGIREGRIEGNTLILNVDEGIQANFPLEGDMDVLVGGFRLVYRQLNDEAQATRIESIEKPYIIDMRYRNPVIRKSE